ncbi:MAG TPA: DUF3226 domain-containing protein [Urbifossiella sp.]|jgi:hypothetical protein|nr:DUF3226 domain-containing protein [Urbifossiella sp.]
MSKPHPRLLLVEGKDEKWVIPQLIEKAGIPWGEKNERDRWPADIIDYDGVENLLKPGEIEAQLKSPGLTALGVLLDANSDPVGRWTRARARAVGAFPMLPADLPHDGVVIQNADGLRFGVWLMPDCSSPGMLETFLALFVNDPTAGLWPFVAAHCRDAQTLHQAPYGNAHRDKALIHAWLALQDPPGQQLHAAVVQNILRPTSPHADRFVRWFRALFQV